MHVDTDRVEGKAKETEGEIQQKWGEAKDRPATPGRT